MNGPDSKLETAMRRAAEKAADHVQSGNIVGLGSGSAVATFSKVLGERIASGRIERISIVPSSLQAWSIARENNLPLHSDSSHCPEMLHIAIDGADQVSINSRAMIKGGGGALFREKIILSASRRSFILIDSSKVVDDLTRAIPVEVSQFALNTASETIKDDFGGDPVLRKLQKGYPFFTESGNVILDVQMTEPINEPSKVEKSMKNVPGVVEVGIFNCAVEKFYVASPDGSVESI
jgi:ribose 5-phosphate isomerase A